MKLMVFERNFGMRFDDVEGVPNGEEEIFLHQRCWENLYGRKLHVGGGGGR